MARETAGPVNVAARRSPNAAKEIGARSFGEKRTQLVEKEQLALPFKRVQNRRVGRTARSVDQNALGRLKLISVTGQMCETVIRLATGLKNNKSSALFSKIRKSNFRTLTCNAEESGRYKF